MMMIHLMMILKTLMRILMIMLMTRLIEGRGLLQEFPYQKEPFAWKKTTLKAPKDISTEINSSNIKQGKRVIFANLVTRGR